MVISGYHFENFEQKAPSSSYWDFSIISNVILWLGIYATIIGIGMHSEKRPATKELVQQQTKSQQTYRSVPIRDFKPQKPQGTLSSLEYNVLSDDINP